MSVRVKEKAALNTRSLIYTAQSAIILVKLFFEMRELIPNNKGAFVETRSSAQTIHNVAALSPRQLSIHTDFYETATVFLRKLRKLITNPNLYFYDYFAKRINVRVRDRLPGDVEPTYRHLTALGEVGKSAAKALSENLEKYYADHFWEQGSDASDRTLHLSLTSAKSFIAALKAATSTLITEAPSASICVALSSGELVPLQSLCEKHLAPAQKIQILCTEKSIKLSKAEVQTVSRIFVILWEQVFSFNSSPIAETKTPTKRFCRLRIKTFKDYARQHPVVGYGKQPHITQVTFPIDVVYTWVNDKDPHWLHKKQTYPHPVHQISTEWRGEHPERFTNRDELRYSLRSLEQFGSFIRRIYIVSDHQTPDWLNTAHPKISLVSHEEIFADPSCLPTFNSHAIESQLHHISDLSEHFIYFNDDVFLGTLCTPEDFFEANGAVRFFPSDQRLHLPDVDDTREEYLCANRNIARLLVRDRGVEASHIMMHTPHPCSKTYLSELESRYPAEYARCAANRFRHSTDITSITFAQYHFGYLDKAAVPSSISHRYLALWKPQIEAQFRHVLNRRKYKTFCINDAGVPPEEVEAKTALVRDFLESYFPFKSSFEL